MLKQSIVDPKTLSLFALFSVLNILCIGIFQNKSLEAKTHPLIELETGRPQTHIISSEPPADPEPTSLDPSLEPSASIYQNEELGIRFPYPEDVQVQAHESAMSIWTVDDYDQVEEFIEAIPLLIEVRDNPSNLNAWEWFLTQQYILAGEGEVEEQRVGDQYGIVFNWLGMWSFTSVAVPHPTRQTMIVITWDNEMSAYQELFYDTLEALEFI